MSSMRVDAVRRTRRLLAPGATRLAVAGSAAGVVVVAAGVGMLAMSAGTRAASSHRLRTQVASTVHFHAQAGPAAIAAYPPRNPCSLAVVSSTNGTSTIQGSGLGAAQDVSVVYYSGTGTATTALGTWRTGPSGSFDASVQVPSPGTASGYVVARSRSAQCSTPTAPGEPGYPPTTPPTTTPPITTPPVGTTPPTTTPPTSTPPTSTAPTTTHPTTSPTVSSSLSSQQGVSSSAVSPTGATSPSNGVDATSLGTTVTPGSNGTSGSAGTSGNSGPTGSSSAPARTIAPLPTTSPPTALGPQVWGLSTSFIVTMALVLLLLGGLAVLVLTRRSG